MKYDLRALSADSLRAYADIIEKVVRNQFRDATKTIPEEVAVSKMETTTPTCEKSSQVGNAAAMRDALAQAQRVLHCAIVADILKGEDAHEALNAVSTALSAPPRNCDIMDWRTAWAKWRTECHPQKPCGYAEVVSGTEQFMDWYMSEAKEETK